MSDKNKRINLKTGGPWRTRFAPSPTGEMHLGNARTAVLNWLLARQSGGTFLVRLEDTDRERSSFTAEASILDTLAWMGTEPDEPVLRQSGRLAMYRLACEGLLHSGRAYPCFCTEHALEAERETARQQNRPPRYSGKCRTVSRDEALQRIQAGEPHTIRFHAASQEPVTFTDLLKGEMSVPTDAFGDFVILRSTGWPSYNLAVVVDDADMDINLVLRGEDHLTNTARQILLYRALALPEPCFAHHGLLLNEERRKLSKRHGAKSVRELRDEHIHPLSLVHYLASLAGGVKTRKIVSRNEDLATQFNPFSLGRGGVVFSEPELRGLSQAYWHGVSPEDILRKAAPFLSRLDGWNSLEQKRRCSLIAAVQENITCAADLPDLLRFFLSPGLTYSLNALTGLRSPEAAPVIAALNRILQNVDTDPERPMPEDIRSTLIKEISTLSGARGKQLYHPLRHTLTGTDQGPELKTLLEHLPLQWIRKRVKAALEISTPS
jgi:glutamyl-tRNA synthetase/nondiscriminating glutamyl-tRNA synthetase